jgi:hypothetical protein
MCACWGQAGQPMRRRRVAVANVAAPESSSASRGTGSADGSAVGSFWLLVLLLLYRNGLMGLGQKRATAFFFSFFCGSADG